MKKTILLGLVAFIMFSGCFIFDYNGGATIIIKNIGELSMYAIVEAAQSVIEPGEQTTFTLSWPGHEDMHINLITYPSGHPDLGETDHFYISDGEEKIIEKGYYIEDLDTRK